MAIILNNIGFEWPNGKTVFKNLNISLETGTYGIVGPNGVGKTTFARLLCGSLTPTRGSILWGEERVCYFKQDERAPDVSVMEYLAETTFFEEPLLLSFLDEVNFEQSCASLSGGEWARVRLVKTASSGATFLILDEPTNHMDEKGRKAIHDFLEFFQGGILIISHDRELLQLVDRILEISVHGISVFSGNWEVYEEWRQKERSGLARDLELAKKRRHLSELERREKLEKAARRQREGNKKGARGGIPRIVIGGLKRRAEVTMGKIDSSTGQELDKAVSEAREAFKRLKVDPVMFASLPAVSLPQGKMIVEARDFNFMFEGAPGFLWKDNLNFSVLGSSRVAIVGENGSGKSTLLQLLNKTVLPGSSYGEIRLGTVEVGYLDQNYSLLEHDRSILSNVQKTSDFNDVELRNFLAMFLFQGESVHQRISELSGGERLRAALAKVLLASPPANVLLLDEPTNNLDIPNIEFLEQLLRQYEGALIVISHDKKFLEQLKLDQIINLR